MEYKVILFDADNTLFDFKKTENYALENLMSSLDTDYDKDYCINIYKEINTKIWKEFEEGKITQSVLKIERFQRLKEALRGEFQAADFAERYTDHLAEASFPYDESHELLQKLSGKVKMGIITNGLKKVQRKRISQSVLSHYFEAIVISEEVQVSKPDERIFELTMDLLGDAPKGRVLMVGDSLGSDILGGIRFGIDTCWFNPSGKDNKGEIVPTYEISHLHEILNLL